MPILGDMPRPAEMQQKRFSYQAGYSKIEFIVYIINGKISVIESDGSSFNFGLMPLSTWYEVAAWVESVAPKA